MTYNGAEVFIMVPNLHMHRPLNMIRIANWPHFWWWNVKMYLSLNIMKIYFIQIEQSISFKLNLQFNIQLWRADWSIILKIEVDIVFNKISEPKASNLTLVKTRGKNIQYSCVTVRLVFVLSFHTFNATLRNVNY